MFCEEGNATQHCVWKTANVSTTFVSGHLLSELFWRFLLLPLEVTKVPNNDEAQCKCCGLHWVTGVKEMSLRWSQWGLKTGLRVSRSPPQSGHVSRVGSKQQVDDGLDLWGQTEREWIFAEGPRTHHPAFTTAPPTPTPGRNPTKH